MSKDLQTAVNNFALGFSLGDRVMARWEAAQSAKAKWQAMLQWRMADQAERAKRNEVYAQSVKQHGDLMAAQADWYRKRGPGGGAGRVSIGSTGKPAFSAADQAYIDKQVAAGYAPPQAQDTSQQPTVSVEMPEQPPPPVGAAPAPPPDDSGGGATDAAMFSDARGGMIPERRFQRGGPVDYSSMGVGGTSGPGSGYGVRAAPPSYQGGGYLPTPLQDPLFYLNPLHALGRTAATAIRRNTQAMTPAEIKEREDDARMYEDPKAQLPYARPGYQFPQKGPRAKAGAPAATAPTAFTAAPLPSSTPQTDEGMDPFLLPRGGATGGGAPGGGAGAAGATEPDVPPQGVARRGGGGGGGRGAVDTRWKQLGDQTRTKAYDPTLDAADPRNIGIINASGRVNQQAYRASPMMHPEAYPAGTSQFTTGPDYAARWGQTNLFPPTITRTASTPISQPTASGDPTQLSGTGETYRRGGPVRRFQSGGPTTEQYGQPLAGQPGVPPPGFGGPTGNQVVNLGGGMMANLGSPNPALPMGGSAGGATGSGGDAAGGVSGSGGIGGSASAGEGGSAAAGTSGGAADSGDGSGTYRRGGRVRRKQAIRTHYQEGGDVQQASLTPDPSQPPVTFDQYGNPSDVDVAAAGRDAAIRQQRERELRGGNNVGRAGAVGTTDDPAMDRIRDTRLDYEARLQRVKSPEEANSLWQDYKVRMKNLDPTIQFDDEQSPRGGAGAAGATEPDVGPQGRRGAGAAAATEPDVGPQGRPAPRRGALDTSRWKGLRDQTRTEAYDPTKDVADPYNVNMVDPATGQVNPQQGPPGPGPAPTGGPAGGQGPQGVTSPLGGYGLNPQGANAQGAGLSTNNAANDLSPIMKAASDFAGHVFHLTANDEHTAGGYHALMAGHGAAPINLIEAGFQKIDPQGRMPINQKIELLTEHLYDYYAAQNQPEQAAKVAFEVAQFGSQMAKTHAAQAGDLLQKGDFNGAMTHLVGGYNWLVDGHTADYDPRTRMITLRDSKSGQVTGQMQATPQLVQNLTLGMMSGEFNWDAMRGRGGAAPPGGQPPPGQGQPQGPPSRPVVQPAAAPAGPQQTPAAPPPQVSASPTPPPPQGDGGPSGSPADDQRQVAQAVQPTPPPTLTSGRTQRYDPETGQLVDYQPGQGQPAAPTGQPPAPPQITPRRNGVPPAPVYDPNTGTFPNRPDLPPVAAGQQRAGQQPTQTKQPAQGDQGEPVEGSEEWYEKHPHDVPKGQLIRRASMDLPPPPDVQGERNRIEQTRRDRVAQLMADAKGLSQSGKSLIPQFIAQANNKADKELADLEARQKEWKNEAKDQDHQENQNIRDRQVQAQSAEGNIEGIMEDYLVKKRQGFDDMDPVAEAKRARDQLKQGGGLDARGQTFATVNQSPLRYMATPEQRTRLKEIATQIWASNPSHPEMSERQAIEHALNFTSIVAPDAKGHNNNTGAKGTTYRILGYDPLRNIVVENEAGETVHMTPQTLRAIDTLRAANAQEFKEGTAKRARTQKLDKMHGGVLEQTIRGLSRTMPIGPWSYHARALGEILPKEK